MASRDTRRVTVVFGSETREAEAGFRRVGDSAENLHGRTGKLSEAFDKLGPGILAAVGAQSVGLAFTKVIQGASDLNETINKTQQVFKGGGDAILKWSENSAQAMGMSRQAALDNVSAFGNMYEQLGLSEQAAQKMSTRMVQLSADFASFHNADPSDVMDAMLSATRGEYDALQKFVPTVNAAAIQTEALAETHKKSAAALTDAEKATALYNVVIKNAGAANGDFQRTSNSAANQQRILTATLEDSAAKIGQIVLPAYQAMLSIVNGIGPLKLAVIGLAIGFGERLTLALTAATTATVGWVGTLTASVAASTVATGATTRFGTALAAVRGAATAAASGLGRMWASTGAITKLGGTLLALNVAAMAFGTSASPNVDRLTDSLQKLGETGRVTGEAAHAMGSDFDTLHQSLEWVGSGWEVKADTAVQKFMEAVLPIGSLLPNSLEHANESLDGLDASLARLVEGGKAGDAAAVFAKITAEAKRQHVSVHDLNDRFKEYSAALEVVKQQQADTARVAGGDLTKVFSNLQPVFQGNVTDAKVFADALGTVGKSGEDSTLRLTQYGTVLSAVGTSHLSSTDMAKTFADGLTAIEDVAGPLAEKGLTLGGVFDRIGDAQITAKQKGDLLKRTLDDIYGAMQSQVEAAESVVSARDAFTTSLEKNGVQLDINAGKTAAQRAKILSNRDALEAALTATRNKYLADIEAGGNADKARAAYIKQTTAIEKQISPTQRNKTSVKELVGAYDTIPRTKTTTINIDGDKPALIALVKSFALQKAISSQMSKAAADDYLNSLYRTYVVGSGFVGPVAKVHFATGGQVHGWSPHSKADNIPAWLTAREFVQPVDSVDYYGVHTMEALRNKRIPADLMRAAAQGVIPDAYANGTRGYALGGSVTGGSRWPYTVHNDPKNPANLSELQKRFDAMLAGPGLLGGGSGAGGWRWEVDVMRKQFPGIGVYSTTRPGARTLSGNRSYHSIGRAVDFQPIRKAAEWIASTYGKNTLELITPWRDLMLWHGKPHKYSRDIEAQHGVFGNNAHIHWAYDQGGVLPPGITVAHNNTGRNEYVFKEDQLPGSQVTVNVTVQGNVTAEKDLARSIATEVRNELLRKAGRNGGRTGLPAR